MGNRVKGRPKKSSVKAAISSKAGSKRKLSRMGKKRKKNHAGLEATLIGRSKCLKMLQISIKDFRRLCILKGIYPREPLGKTPGNKKSQSFYHIKDIRAIAHEPVLEKFREFRAFMKKVRRSAGRNEQDEALRKNAIMPQYSLHHLVRERYPRFVDALADLDDALTLVFLFACLPTCRNLKAKYITSAKQLAAAWGAYCATTHAITKCFISVKGVYLEAELQNTPIRWVVPHAFTQFLPEDVDFRVMNTFFEFYETLLKFVLFKLYRDIGISYPFTPKDAIGSTSLVLAANLNILAKSLRSVQEANTISQSVKASLEAKDPAKGTTMTPTEGSGKTSRKEIAKSVGAALQQLESDDDDEDEEDTDVAGAFGSALESIETDEMTKTFGERELDDEATKRMRLFQGLTFFLSREVPRGYLELVGLAYGAKVGWEGNDSPISSKDPSITHYILDRPKIPSALESFKNREFVQPQWLVDCANFMVMLPISRYSIGTPLPPHLSPWVDNQEEGYTPKYAEEIERIKNGEPMEALNEDEDDDEEEAPKDVGSFLEESATDNDNVGDDDEKKANKKKKKTKQAVELPDEEDNEDPAIQDRIKRKRDEQEQEAQFLAKSMMNRKAAHLYGRMQHGIAKKQAKVDNLQKRRKELDEQVLKGKIKDSSGKTPLKQKVERLQKERKLIEDTYNDTGGSMKSKRNQKKQKRKT